MYNVMQDLFMELVVVLAWQQLSHNHNTYKIYWLVHVLWLELRIFEMTTWWMDEACRYRDEGSNLGVDRDLIL